MTPGDPIPAAILIVRLLERLQVPYLIGGSFASSLYGLPRSTNDVDVVAELHPYHVEVLVQALEADFAVSEQAIREAIDRHRSFNAIPAERLRRRPLSPWERDRVRASPRSSSQSRNSPPTNHRPPHLCTTVHDPVIGPDVHTSTSASSTQ